MPFDETESEKQAHKVDQALENAVAALHDVITELAELARVQLAEGEPNSATDCLLIRRRIEAIQQELEHQRVKL